MQASSEVVLRQEKFISFARIAYLAGVVLALVLVVPTAWFPFQIGKLAIAATCFAIAAILFVLGGGVRNLARGSGVKFLLLSALLPVAYVLSFASSVDRSVGLMGLSFDTDTLVFVCFGFLSLLLAFALFRSARLVRQLVLTIFFSLIAAAVFQCIAVAFGSSVIPFQTFADRSVNLIGKWNDLGLLMGALALWCLLRLEWTPLTTLKRGLFITLLVLVGILLGLIHFTVVWGLLCAFAVFSLVASRVVPTAERIKFPWYSLIVTAVSVLFIIFGTSINSGLTKVFPVSSVEVRPSYSSTVSVVGVSHPSVGRALIGTGPDTFRQTWMLNKPSEVNLSPFWNLDFNVGYSTLLTAFADVGLLGALAWLLPLVIAVFALITLLRSPGYGRAEKLQGIAVGSIAVYLWVASGFYVLSQNLVLLAFIATGALIGLVYGALGTEEETSPALRGITWVIAVLAAIGMIVIGVASDRLLVAEAYANKGLVALGAGDIPSALSYADKAVKYDKNGDTLRFQVQANLAQLQQLAVASTTQSADTQKQFVDLAQKTIGEGKEATTLTPHDYRAYVALGQVYDFLASLNVKGAYELAQGLYANADKEDPTNPQIPLLQARLEAAHGNIQGTQNFLKQSLTLKQNYTDAILFVVQLDVAQKDLPNAIQAAQAAVKSAPGVAPIWFELGLLYYAGGDTADAIIPLQQAVQLQNNYANAKYFLGLSYYAQGKTSDAIVQFKDLQTANPDNAEVALILSNMEANKPAFTSAQPPITPHPETRATAPISQ